MKSPVSKARAKKAKSRERRAVRRNGSRLTVHEHPAVGLGVALLLWVTAVALLALDPGGDIHLGPAYLLPLMGNGAFLLAALLAAGLFLKTADPATAGRNATLLLLALVALLALLLGRLLMYVSETTMQLPFAIAIFLLPLALAPLLATMLTGSAAGTAVGVWTALAMSTMAERSFVVLVTGLVATVVTTRLSQNIRTRTRVFRTGVTIGLTETLCVLGITAVNWQHPDIFLVVYQSGACLISGCVSAAVALLILPLFEGVFRITTDITLLENSDMGHPLLQRLAIEAPGTYHHSLVVASLAQAAADEIGANGLLARVCAYFHDVGKLTKPDFFAENIHARANPHDELPPSMSTLIITSHVKEGLSMAMLHKLPDPVTRVIREHHGTSVLSFFHHKAKEKRRDELEQSDGQNGNGSKLVDEVDFRYSGPTPSTRDSGIISLADAVEAASRSLEKTTPVHIENLVNDIVNTKLLDGQLDACPLSIAEITRIKRSFVFTLRSMLHGRIPYPKDEDRGDQPSRKPSRQREAGREADGAPDAVRQQAKQT